LVTDYFPLRVEELNRGTNVGTKHEPYTQDAKARRSLSYDSFYKQAANWSNLEVLTMLLVQQVVLSKSNNDVTATGVVYMDYATGQTLNATASKEVIMSAGAIKTPQLLMLLVC
jgi:choline dehydrogenase-like flavoprotein